MSKYNSINSFQKQGEGKFQMNLQRMQTTTDIIHSSIEFRGTYREILETPIFIGYTVLYKVC